MRISVTEKVKNINKGSNCTNWNEKLSIDDFPTGETGDCHHHNPRCSQVLKHYSDVTMNAMVSQITSVSILCKTVCADQWKHRSSASLPFVRGIEFPSQGARPVTREIFPFDDVIMKIHQGDYLEISLSARIAVVAMMQSSFWVWAWRMREGATQ